MRVRARRSDRGSAARRTWAFEADCPTGNVATNPIFQETETDVPRLQCPASVRMDKLVFSQNVVSEGQILMTETYVGDSRTSRCGWYRFVKISETEFEVWNLASDRSRSFPIDLG